MNLDDHSSFTFPPLGIIRQAQMGQILFWRRQRLHEQIFLFRSLLVSELRSFLRGRKENFPTKQYIRARTDFGHRFFIPKDPIAELVYLYGAKWMIPLKNASKKGYAHRQKVVEYKVIPGIANITKMGVDIKLLKENMRWIEGWDELRALSWWWLSSTVI